MSNVRKRPRLGALALASMHRWGGVWSGVVTQKCLSDQEE